MTQLINIGLAFLEGLALILSPCILPILPIMLAASISGSNRRPYGIILGFVLSFALFTFFSRSLVQLLGISSNVIRDTAFIVLAIFGVIMLSSYLTERFSVWTQKFANIGFKLTDGKKATSDDLRGGFIFGCLVGLIWTPCAGPILAAVIVQSILQTSTVDSLLTILAFAIGAAIPMLLLIIFGRTLINKFNLFQQHAKLFRKILGIIILASIAVIYFLPNLLITNDETTVNDLANSQTGLIDGLQIPYAAPSIQGISAWINSPPLTLEQLHGKVVLIDFWAYSCINCIRTLPYLKSWYQKYNKDGLVIIGVHSPEFDFERELSNVQKAVQQLSITYPVALDNQFVTWANYNNHFWPAHYLIDKNGVVVYTHFGEGAYNVTEHNIRYLLGLNPAMPNNSESAKPYMTITPETYLGYQRGRPANDPSQIQNDRISNYTYPDSLNINSWALLGKWQIAKEKVIAEQDSAAIKLNFQAKQVYAVMGPTGNQTITVNILLNGKPYKQLNIDSYKLYTLIELGVGSEANATLELITDMGGLEIYTFTFGSASI